jgi:hypothetical protein
MSIRMLGSNPYDLVATGSEAGAKRIGGSGAKAQNSIEQKLTRARTQLLLNPPPQSTILRNLVLEVEASAQGEVVKQ